MLDTQVDPLVNQTLEPLAGNGLAANLLHPVPATPPPPHRPRRRGRPAKYGKKIKVAALLKEEDQLQEAPSPVYGEQAVILTGWRP